MVATQHAQDQYPGVTFLGPFRALPMTEARLKHVEAAREARAAWLRERKAKIEEMITNAAANGENADRGYWTLVYDMEMSPTTSGRTMLLELEIIPVPPQELHGSQEVHEALWTVIEGLAACGVYLMHTDHLTDSQLYERLYYRILDEPTQRLPPSAGAAEYIDVLHPWDLAAGGFAKELSELIAKGRRTGSAGLSNMRAPVQDAALCDRDRFLPGSAKG